MEPHIVKPEVALKIDEWLRTRGGIAVWESIDLSDPGFGLTTPALSKDSGEPTLKPSWKVANNPARVITNAADILVSTDVEVARFYVAVRISGNGLSMKCTDGATRRIRAALAKAGEGAYNSFDYSQQQAVIYKPSVQVSLADWLKGQTL